MPDESAFLLISGCLWVFGSGGVRRMACGNYDWIGRDSPDESDIQGGTWI